MAIGENIEKVRARIAAAARAVGRDPVEVRLICVTKGVAVSRIQEAISCGVQEIGENRVQEVREKRPQIGRQVRWHLIGTLQRNKTKWAVELFDFVHSVDSLELIEALDRHGNSKGRKLEVLIQVNVSGEAAKHGCRPQEGVVLAEAILKSKNLTWAGLMTMAPFTENPESTRPIFRRFRELRDDLQKQFASSLAPHSSLQLSMGMSQDFEVAVEEGATMVRIGTAIFHP